MKLSVCMIVKNEEKTLARCLYSIKDIADEIIFVDTGSTDKTTDIAQEFGAKVFSFIWQDNFSAARNFSLEKATGDWVLVIDADEVLSSGVGDKLKTVLSQQKDYKAFRILQRTYSNAPLNPNWKKVSKTNEEAKGFKGYGDVPITRVFVNNPEIRFIGEVHEDVDPSLKKLNFPITNTDIILHHYEYEKGDDYVNKKQLHYLDLCLEKEKIQPENAKNFNDIGTIYRNYKQDTKKAEEYFKKSIKSDSNFIKAYNNLAEIHVSQNNLKQAAKILEKASKQKQSAQTFSNLGMIYAKLEDFDKAIEAYRKALKIDPQRPRALSNLGVVYLKKGDEESAVRAFKHALNMDKKNISLYLQLAALYDKRKDKENAIKFYTYLIKMKHPQKDIFEKRIAVLNK